VILTASLTGCASATEHRPAPQPPPRLPRVLAHSLALQSDQIAQALESGDSCRASSLARVLQAQTIAAINARRVPGAFQEPLTSTVTDLVSRIRCVPPPTDEKPGEGKKEGHGKHERGGD
jgi:hypothetical protein